MVVVVVVSSTNSIQCFRWVGSTANDGQAPRADTEFTTVREREAAIAAHAAPLLQPGSAQERRGLQATPTPGDGPVIDPTAEAEDNQDFTGERAATRPSAGTRQTHRQTNIKRQATRSTTTTRSNDWRGPEA